jgi:hypothetical protein
MPVVPQWIVVDRGDEEGEGGKKMGRAVSKERGRKRRENVRSRGS